MSIEDDKKAERSRQYSRKYRAAHLEKVHEKDRNYYKAHRDEISEKQKKYRQAHPEIGRKKAKRYSQAHPDKIREKERNQNRVSITVPIACKPILDSLKDSTAMSLTEIFATAVEEKYSVTLLPKNKQNDKT